MNVIGQAAASAIGDRIAVQPWRKTNGVSHPVAGVTTLTFPPDPYTLGTAILAALREGRPLRWWQCARPEPVGQLERALEIKIGSHHRVANEIFIPALSNGSLRLVPMVPAAGGSRSLEPDVRIVPATESDFIGAAVIELIGLLRVRHRQGRERWSRDRLLAMVRHVQAELVAGQEGLDVERLLAVFDEGISHPDVASLFLDDLARPAEEIVDAMLSADTPSKRA